MTSSLLLEVWGSLTGPVKLYTSVAGGLAPLRGFFEAVLPRCYAADMGFVFRYAKIRFEILELHSQFFLQMGSQHGIRQWAESD